MNSVILQIASKYVRALLLIFALIVLFRGHNHPGGGFIGGMLAGLSVAYRGFAYQQEEVRNNTKIQPEYYIAFGFFLILVSMVPSLIMGHDLMTGEWLKLNTFLGQIKLGTPLIFDVGVFSAVIGVTILFMFSLNRQNLWK